MSTSAIDCLERLVPEMTHYVSSGTLNPTNSLTEPVPSPNQEIHPENGDDSLALSHQQVFHSLT